MAKTALIKNGVWVASKLDTLDRTGKLDISYALTRTMAENGLLEAKEVKTQGRGRNKKIYVPSARGRKFLESVRSLTAGAVKGPKGFN